MYNYVLLQSVKGLDFNDLCDDYAEKGWEPIFNVIITHAAGAADISIYTQQWRKKQS